MDRRRRGAALAGSGAAIAASASVLTNRHGDWGYFAFGLAFGLALTMIVLAAFLIARGDKNCPRA